MRTTEIAIAAIKGFEGCKLTAYKCPAGVWTIGYGHTHGVKQGMTITSVIADELLREDVKLVEKELERYNLPNLTNGQYDAIVDFCFNLGSARFRSSTLYKKIMENPKDASGITAEFKKWIYSKNQVLQGLVKRREWEVRRWEASL